MITGAMQMEKFLISLGIGMGAALVDVLLTYKYEANKYTLAAIAVHWLAVGLFMPYIDLGTAVWLKGLLVGLALALPFMVMEIPKDPKAIIPMVIFSPIMGIVIAVVSDKLVP
jgi:cytochrome b561